MILCKDKCQNLPDIIDEPYIRGYVRCSHCEKYMNKNMLIDNRLCFCCNGLIRIKPRNIARNKHHRMLAEMRRY